QGEAIYPTPIIGMVGLFESLEDITPNSFQNAGDLIYMIGETDATFGGSELKKVVLGKYEGKAPAFNVGVEKGRQESLLETIQDGLIESAEDVSEGGLAVCLAESVIRADGIGAKVDLTGNVTEELFSETQSRFVVTVTEENRSEERSVGRACEN